MPSLQTVLIGRQYSPFQRNLRLLFALGILVSTFAAYGLGLFAASGGVIFVPGDATTIGLVAAILIGFEGGGFLFAWLAQFAAYLGFRADWAFLSLSSHDFPGQVAYFFDPEGLFVDATMALIFSAVGFGLGYLARWVLGRLRGEESLRDAAE
jgi:hypothetical protein